MKLVAWERASGVALVQSEGGMYLLRPPFQDMEPLTDVLVDRLTEAFRLEPDGTEYNDLSSLITGLRGQLTFIADLSGRPLDKKSTLLRTLPKMPERTFAQVVASTRESLDPSDIFALLEAVHISLSQDRAPQAPWMSSRGVEGDMHAALRSMTNMLPILMEDWYAAPMRDKSEYEIGAGHWKPPTVMLPSRGVG